MPALAITDTNNLFGALEFSEKLAKAGVQPIIGAQMTVDFGDAPPARLAPRRAAHGARADRAPRPERGRLPQPDAARLARSGSIRRTATSRISRSTRSPAREGLIALTGGPAGPIDRALGADWPISPRARLERLAQAFDATALCRTAAPRARSASARSSRR